MTAVHSGKERPLMMDANREVCIALSLEQCAMVLQALAELPFKNVFELIGRLNQQSHHYLSAGVDARVEQPYRFGTQDLALCIRALGDMPFNRVNRLLQSMHAQISAQAGTAHRVPNDAY